MLNEITNQRVSDLPSNPFAAPEAKAQGKLIGKAVVEVINPQSVLQDAMEELSYNFNKSKDYALKSRKERDSIDRNTKSRLKAFQKVVEAQEVSDPNKDLEELSKVLDEKNDRDTLLDAALQKHEEPAEAWAALEKLAENLKEKGADPKKIDTVNEAIALLDMRYGAAIRAGVIGTLTASENFVSIGTPLDLGSTYRKAVFEFTSTLDLYSYIQNKHGGNFEKAVEFLYASLKADQACDTPSADVVSLQSLNTSLGKLRSFQSAHAICTQEINNLVKDQDKLQINPKFTGLKLLGDLLTMSQNNFVGADEVLSITREAHISKIEDRIIFLQGLLQGVRNFSPLVFDLTDGRRNVIQAVQQAVDQSVNEEDALLASNNS